jgi:hypothetical protein
MLLSIHIFDRLLPRRLGGGTRAFNGEFARRMTTEIVKMLLAEVSKKAEPPRLRAMKASDHL